MTFNLLILFRKINKMKRGVKILFFFLLTIVLLVCCSKQKGNNKVIHQPTFTFNNLSDDSASSVTTIVDFNPNGIKKVSYNNKSSKRESASLEQHEFIENDENQVALRTAQSYMNQYHLSKKRLYQKLMSSDKNNFSSQAIQYAVDHIRTDYNQNALLTAQDYHKFQDLSLAKIKKQLISTDGEQFTVSEADYALQHLFY